MSARYMVCINNGGGAEHLELRKLYRVLPDDVAAADGLIRVIDESDEDYLYPASYFAPVELSDEAEQALAAT